MNEGGGFPLKEVGKHVATLVYWRHLEGFTTLEATWSQGYAFDFFLRTSPKKM